MIKSYSTFFCAILGTGIFLSGTPAFPEPAAISGTGRLRTLSLDGNRLPVQTDIRIADHDWKTVHGLDDMRDVHASRTDTSSTWSGQLELSHGGICRIEEAFTTTSGVTDISVSITAETDLNVDGAYFWLDVPVSAFAGGACHLTSRGKNQGDVIMPREQARARHFLVAKSDRVNLTSPDGNTNLSVALDRSCPIALQDNRHFNSDTYSIFFALALGPLSKGSVVPLHLTSSLKGSADHSPAKLTIAPEKRLYDFDGFGGDYCFQIESPVTQYTLNNLHVAWARTEMSLIDWAPQNNQDSSTNADWTYLKGNDKENSRLRHEFLLAKQIQERGVPYVISVWSLPEWMYVDPGRSKDDSGRRIAPDKWPEVLESIGSYLLYAKQQYGVEPDLFSFNEPDVGVHVRLSPEEHRDAIKLIGPYLKTLGLKTRMLLGDTTCARNAQKYVQPTVNDSDAMKYVGAVSFHSWGGATPDQYRTLNDVAVNMKRPLLVTELGVDASAWHSGSLFQSYDYGLREAEMYQEILLYAHPRGTMQWEFTGDYPLAESVKGEAAMQATVVPTTRFWLVKHFCNLTPHKAQVLATTSDNPLILFTAFSSGQDFTFHILNTGPARHATISGLPSNLTDLTSVRTSESESFKTLPRTAVDDGVVELELSAQSLLTLTTLPVARPASDIRKTSDIGKTSD